MRIPPLKINTLLETNPLIPIKGKISERGPANYMEPGYLRRALRTEGVHCATKPRCSELCKTEWFKAFGLIPKGP